MRTMVAPSAMAAGMSDDMPIDKVSVSMPSAASSCCNCRSCAKGLRCACSVCAGSGMAIKPRRHSRGIAATARDPDAVRMFTDPDRDRAPDDDRRGMRLPDGRTATIAAAGALIAGAVGLGIAGLLVWWLDPATANRATALVAGAVIGALVGTAVAVRLVRGRS